MYFTRGKITKYRSIRKRKGLGNTFKSYCGQNTLIFIYSTATPFFVWHVDKLYFKWKRFDGQVKTRKTIYFTYILNIWTYFAALSIHQVGNKSSRVPLLPIMYANLYPSKYFPFYCNVLLLFILDFTTTDCVKTNGGQFEFVIQWWSTGQK